MQIDAVEIALDPALLDDGPFRGLRNEDARIHLFERTARARDGNAAEDHVFSADGDDVAFAVALDRSAGFTAQRHRLANRDGAGELCVLQHQLIARLGSIDSLLQGRYGSRRETDRFRPGRRRNGGDYRHHPEHCCLVKTHHAFFGSTNIRPFISMCMAWQNQEQ
ncbi:hypothetical protein D9M69_610700 [compost metagenome]